MHSKPRDLSLTIPFRPKDPSPSGRPPQPRDPSLAMAFRPKDPSISGRPSLPMPFRPKNPSPSVRSPQPKPQVHTQKHHNSYNGTSDPPITISVQRRRRSSAFTVTLYYSQNRACTIVRTRDDFAALERGLPIRGPFAEPGYRVQVSDLQKFLEEVLGKCKGECALERFLRRRMGDCGY